METCVLLIQFTLVYELVVRGTIERTIVILRVESTLRNSRFNIPTGNVRFSQPGDRAKGLANRLNCAVVVVVKTGLISLLN